MTKLVALIILTLFVSVSNAQLVTNNLPAINYIKRQEAVSAFQKDHDRACKMVPAVCSLPTLKFDSSYAAEIEDVISEELTTVIVSLRRRYNQLPPGSTQSKKVYTRMSELKGIRLSLLTNAYLFSLSFLNVYQN